MTQSVIQREIQCGSHKVIHTTGLASVQLEAETEGENNYSNVSK